MKWPTSIENNFIWTEIKRKRSAGKLEINANKHIYIFFKQIKANQGTLYHLSSKKFLNVYLTTRHTF